MSQLLQEYVDSRGVAVSVDREVGILRGVKLIGLQSRNGRRYQESALASAATLYEESKVNINHPKDGALAPRDYQDRLGVIRGVELRRGEGLFGDLHFNPKHALAEQLLWDAEHNPHNVGFSHNVLARVSRDGEVVVVEEITKVQSVDLVADPATTQGLFEQATKKLSDVSDKEQIFDALTLEALRLHRPDLLDEYQSSRVQQLEQKVCEAQTRTEAFEKKHRVLKLLCEYQLSVAREESKSTRDRKQEVSPLFVEWLTNVSDEQELEALIAERAELVHDLKQEQQLRPGQTSPRSRDQMSVLDVQSERLGSPQDFANALKCSRN